MHLESFLEDLKKIAGKKKKLKHLFIDYNDLNYEPEYLEEFLKLGVDINVQIRGGYTALSYAAINQNPEVAAFLVSKGADPNIVCKHNTTALSYAVLFSDSKTAKVLINAGADLEHVELEKYNILHQALRRAEDQEESVEVVRLLVDAGIKVDSVRSGVAAIARACSTGRLEIVRFLVEAGADVNQPSNLSALQTSVMYPDIVKYLLEQGADVNAMNQFDCTALTYAAARKGNLEVVKLLVEAGAEVNPPSEECSPLQLAIRKNSYEVVSYLLQQGADIHHINSDGKSVTDYLSHKSSAELKDLIEGKLKK